MKSVFELTESDLYNELNTIQMTNKLVADAMADIAQHAHINEQREIAIVLDNMYNELVSYLCGRRMLCRQALARLADEA